ncbi:DpnD/PcfM family protein, partial [Bacteroides thetaiotaomicron]
MKKYRIAIEETLRKVVEIEAETPGLAVCRVEDEYNEEKHVLSADNFAGADIALSTDDITVMETLENVDFIGYVQHRFEECRESISVEDKVRLAFGSFDNALYEFGEYRKEAARNRPQVYLLYRSDAWHNRSSMELIAPFSSLENMMEYLRRKKKEFRLTES